MEKAFLEMSEKVDVDTMMSTFLRKMADDIENHKLTDEQIQKIGEFYMEYVFDEQVKCDNEETEISDINFKKFLVLGWYIHHMILKGEHL